MKRSRPSMDAILEAQVQMLATTRRPKTVKCYRYCAHNFLAYLHTTFPRLHKLSQLRRDPHLLAWFRFLCLQYPSPGNRTRHLHLLTVRRLLRDLANQGYPVTPDLIGREDFPPSDHYLPKPLSLEEDQQLQHQLRLADALEGNALRLMRATGIRISECINLPLDCYSRSVNSKWRFACPWASSIPNAWSRLMRRRSRSWRAWWSWAPSPPLPNMSP